MTVIANVLKCIQCLNCSTRQQEGEHRDLCMVGKLISTYVIYSHVSLLCSRFPLTETSPQEGRGDVCELCLPRKRLSYNSPTYDGFLDDVALGQGGTA